MVQLYLRQHPQRDLLEQELQQRFFPPLDSPCQLCQFVLTLSSISRPAEFAAMQELAQNYGKQLEPHEQDCNLQLGKVLLRWERHNEFSTYTFIRPGAAATLFCDPKELVPEPEWFSALPGQLFRVVQLSIIRQEALERHDPSSLFADEHLISSTVFNDKAQIWTDFRKHDEGAGRMLLLDKGLSRSALGALVQQLFDLGNYRKLALLAWPYCKLALQQLPQQEQQLAVITQRIEQKQGNDEQLLDELIQLAAQTEHQISENSSRLQASHAYYQLTLDRLKSLNETPVEGLMSLQHFTERRLTPAWRTAQSVLKRQQHLAERLGRSTELLRTQINLKLAWQNQSLLASMDKRAHLQLKLQSAVERLSVVAISYYSLQLLTKAQQAIVHWLPNWPADTIESISIPLVVAMVLWYFWHLRKQIEPEQKD